MNELFQFMHFSLINTFDTNVYILRSFFPSWAMCFITFIFYSIKWRHKKITYSPKSIQGFHKKIAVEKKKTETRKQLPRNNNNLNHKKIYTLSIPNGLLSFMKEVEFYLISLYLFFFLFLDDELFLFWSVGGLIAPLNIILSQHLTATAFSF